MRKKWIFGAPAVLVICVLLAILYFRGKRAPEMIQTTGIVESIEVNLAPKVAGKIVFICCKEGDEVKEGDTVIQLESEDLKASLDEALAGVEMARADISAAESSVESEAANIKNIEGGIAVAEADVNKSQVQMEEAKREWDRSTDLHERGIISQEEYDIAKSNYDASAADYAASKSRLASSHSQKDAAVAQLETGRNQVNLKKAALKQAETTVSFAQAKLADTTIKAPISGTVVYKALESGETVSFGETILTLVDLKNLYVRVDVDESKIGSVVLDRSAAITVASLPGQSFMGKVVEVGRYADFATQRDVVRGRQDIKTFRVKIGVENSRGILKPGMTVDVEIQNR
jgi:HlyD family secretion protein